MRKILILAGLRVDTELRDPETVALISKVLEEFDPHSVIDEDEAMFSSRFNDFERKKRKAERAGEDGGGRVR